MPASLAEIEDITAWEGQFYSVHDRVEKLPDGRVQLKAVSKTGTLEVGTITFQLEGGQSEIEWHDTDPAD